MMLAVFAVFAALFFVAERFYAVRRQPIFRRGFVTDVIYVPIHFFMRALINITLAVSLAEWGSRWLPGTTIGVMRAQPVWLQAVAILLVLDFMFYVLHRAKHRWQWYWRLHETHHSSMDPDWLSGARFHPIEKISDRAIFLLPLVVLGASDGAILIWAAVDAFFGMFNHANVDWRLGPLIYVFNGPELHRWHHARDRAMGECNYGNNFSIFDWLFGTAYLAGDQPAAFGVEDLAYPEGNIVKQFFYAFRPLPAPQSAPSRRPRHALAE